MFRKRPFRKNDRAPSGPRRPQIPQAIKSEITRVYGSKRQSEDSDDELPPINELDSRFTSQRTVMSRKDRRKLEKAQKKQRKLLHYDRIHGRAEHRVNQSNVPKNQPKVSKENDKKRKREEPEELDSDEFGSDIDEDNPLQKHTRLIPEDNTSKPKKAKFSDAADSSAKSNSKLERFAEESAADDAVLRDLKKKLGIKKGKAADAEYDWILGGLKAGSGALLAEAAPDLRGYMKRQKTLLENDEDAALVDELIGDAPEIHTFSSRASKLAKSAASAPKAVKFDRMIDSDSEDNLGDEDADEDEDSGEEDHEYDDESEEDIEGMEDSENEAALEGSDMEEELASVEGDSDSELSSRDAPGSEDDFGVGVDDGSDMEGLEEIYGKGKLEHLLESEEAEEDEEGYDEQEEQYVDNDGNQDDEQNSNDGLASSEADDDEATASLGERTPVIAPTSKYVPPHLRKQQRTDDPKVAQMKKELRGLINRLGEGNLLKVAQSIEELYRYNSRNMVNEAFSDYLIDDCLQSVGAAQVFTFTMVYGALVAILQTTIGPEVGGALIEKLAKEFEKRNTSDEENAAAINKNLLLMFVYLFNFKVIHVILMYDIANKLAERFEESDLDMLLLLIKNCGSSLRAEDPGSLKEFIQAVNQKAVDAKSKKGAITGGITRVDFMLETLADLKNNKLKLQNKDTNINVQRLQKLIENHMKERFGSYTAPETLKISWNELLSDKKSGRWWQVGAAFQMPNNIRQDAADDDKVNLSVFSADVLALAKAQKMNTDVRRAIFCILLTSEDYLDAFEKLMHLQLKNKQDREIIFVMSHCVQQENKFNPFYAHLAKQLCEFQKGNSITLKFALWDKLKIMEELSTRAASNLAKFYAQLFAEGCLSLAVLKAVEWDSMGPMTIVFLRVLFSSLLLVDGPDTVETVFRRIAGVAGLEQLKDNLTLFFIQSLLPAEPSEEKASKLRLMSKIARKSMKNSGSLF